MEEEGKSCGSCKGFNYCFWAKLIVAIPALPLIGLVAASFFKEPALQLLAGAVAIVATIALAKWFDRLPLFSKKMCGKDKE